MIRPNFSFLIWCVLLAVLATNSLLDHVGLDRENGLRVRLEHIHVALRELAGIADHEYSRKFPFKTKDGEKLKDLWTGA